MIKQKQLLALDKVTKFIESQNLDNPNLTGHIWQLINEFTGDFVISYEESKKFNEIGDKN